MAKQFDPRRAKEAGQTVRYTLPDGTERTLTAEATGEEGYAVFRPKTADDEGILDTFGFPRAQKAIRAQKEDK